MTSDCRVHDEGKFDATCTCPTYRATHWSIHDGSDAMEIVVPGNLFVLINEDGESWAADPADWRTAEEMLECIHCGRSVVLDEDRWVDPYAGYDTENGDGIWREVCMDHDTVTAEHEIA